MAGIARVALVAGNVLNFQRFISRLSVAICLCLSSIHTYAGELAGEELLVPWRTLTGGWTATRMDQNGIPLPGSFKGFTTFIFPESLAVRGPDLYIGDTGARKIYRFNLDMQALSVLPDVSALSGMRLQVSLDQSLYVLDPIRSQISRWSRGGQKLLTVSSPISSARLSEFILLQGGSKIYAVDQLNQQVVSINSFGTSDLPFLVAGRVGVSTMGALASADQMLFLLDTACVCVIGVADNGEVKERFGEEFLKLPRAMVVDAYGRVFVSDGFDHSLKVFQHGALLASYPAKQLGVMDISSMAIDQGALYIADGPGAKVHVFRIRIPVN